MTKDEFIGEIEALKLTDSHILVIRSDSVDIEMLAKIREQLSNRFGFKVPVIAIGSEDDIFTVDVTKLGIKTVDQGENNG